MGKVSVPGTKRCAGFTQIEVLVAVLVLAIGILGMTGLQIVSLQNSSSSVLRTQAVNLSYELLDRVRANPDAAVTAIKASSVAFGTPSSAPSCVGSNCNAAQMFAYDLLEWKCSLGKYASESVCTTLAANSNTLLDLSAGLPEGDGSIAINGSDEYTIIIRWQEGRNSADADPQFTSFELKGKL